MQQAYGWMVLMFWVGCGWSWLGSLVLVVCWPVRGTADLAWPWLGWLGYIPLLHGLSSSSKPAQAGLTHGQRRGLQREPERMQSLELRTWHTTVTLLCCKQVSRIAHIQWVEIAHLLIWLQIPIAKGDYKKEEPRITAILQSVTTLILVTFDAMIVEIQKAIATHSVCLPGKSQEARRVWAAAVCGVQQRVSYNCEATWQQQ